MTNTHFQKPEVTFNEALTNFELLPSDPVFAKPPTIPKKEELKAKLTYAVCASNIYNDIKNIVNVYHQTKYDVRQLSTPSHQTFCHLHGIHLHQVIEEHFLFKWHKLYNDCITTDPNNANTLQQTFINELFSYAMSIIPTSLNCSHCNYCTKNYATKNLQRFFNSFEENVLLTPLGKPEFAFNGLITASDNRVLKHFFNTNIANTLFSFNPNIVPDDHIPLIKLILNDYIEKKEVIYGHSKPMYPSFISISQIKLLYKLLDVSKYKSIAETLLTTKHNIANFAALYNKFTSVIYYSDIMLHLNTSAHPNTKTNYLKIIKVLHTITNGNLSKLKSLAKFFAELILTPEVCDSLGIKNKRISLLTTNNTKFIKHFFIGVLNFVYEDSIQNFGYLNGHTNIKYNSALNTLKMNYNGFPVESRFPYMPYKLYGNKKKYFHVSTHSMQDYLVPENTGKFIEDKFYGNIINISEEPIRDNNSFEKFTKFLDTNTLSYSDSLLGHQKITLNSKYLFITNEANSFETLANSKLEFDHFALSQSIPEDKCVFNEHHYVVDNNTISDFGEELNLLRDAVAFNQYEKHFMTVDFPLYGLSLILDEANDINAIGSDMVSDSNISIDSTETEFLAYFFKHCCQKINLAEKPYYGTAKVAWDATTNQKVKKDAISEDDVLRIDNGFMIPKTLLESLFNTFYQHITGLKATLTITYNHLPIGTKLERNIKTPKELYIKLTEKFGEIGHEQDNSTTHVFGITVLSKEIILQQAESLKNGFANDSTTDLSISDFADFLFTEVASPELKDSLKPKTK